MISSARIKLQLAKSSKCLIAICCVSQKLQAKLASFALRSIAVLLLTYLHRFFSFYFCFVFGFCFVILGNTYLKMHPSEMHTMNSSEYESSPIFSIHCNSSRRIVWELMIVLFFFRFGSANLWFYSSYSLPSDTFRMSVHGGMGMNCKIEIQSKCWCSMEDIFDWCWKYSVTIDLDPF